jgi:hypothetical protein
MTERAIRELEPLRCCRGNVQQGVEQGVCETTMRDENNPILWAETGFDALECLLGATEEVRIGHITIVSPAQLCDTGWQSRGGKAVEQFLTPTTLIRVVPPLA